MPGFPLERWQTLSLHLDQILDLPAEERAGWLARLGATDPELAADLRSLIEEQQTLHREGFLETTGSPPSARGRAYLIQARALLAEGKHDEAKAAASAALRHLQAALGPDHPDTRAARRLAEPDTSAS